MSTMPLPTTTRGFHLPGVLTWLLDGLVLYGLSALPESCEAYREITRGR